MKEALHFNQQIFFTIRSTVENHFFLFVVTQLKKYVMCVLRIEL